MQVHLFVSYWVFRLCMLSAASKCFKQLPKKPNVASKVCRNLLTQKQPTKNKRCFESLPTRCKGSIHSRRKQCDEDRRYPQKWCRFTSSCHIGSFVYVCCRRRLSVSSSYPKNKRCFESLPKFPDAKAAHQKPTLLRKFAKFSGPVASGAYALQG